MREPRLCHSEGSGVPPLRVCSGAHDHTRARAPRGLEIANIANACEPGVR
jgi:hypothetical protein